MNELTKVFSLSFFLACAAYFLGDIFPIVGGPAFGIIFGILIGNITGWCPPATCTKVSKKLLAVSLSLLGFGLSLEEVFAAGSASLFVMVFTLAAAFITAFVFGSILKIPRDMTSLIGMGTAICGGSAIMALAPVIKANDDDIAYAISTIFLYNLIAVFIFPPLGHLLGLSDFGFGLWAGTAINDTSSVLAAGYAVSHEAGDFAAIVKLSRTTLIVPVCLVFAFLTAKKEQGNSFRPLSAFKALPNFIIYFLIASALVTVGIVPNSLAVFLSSMAKLLIIWALAAVGLGSNFKKMAKSGLRPFILGLLVWAAVSLTALLVQHMTGKW